MKKKVVNALATMFIILVIGGTLFFVIERPSAVTMEMLDNISEIIQ